MVRCAALAAKAGAAEAHLGGCRLWRHPSPQRSKGRRPGRSGSKAASCLPGCVCTDKVTKTLPGLLGSPREMRYAASMAISSWASPRALSRLYIAYRPCKRCSAGCHGRWLLSLRSRRSCFARQPHSRARQGTGWHRGLHRPSSRRLSSPRATAAAAAARYPWCRLSIAEGGCRCAHAAATLSSMTCAPQAPTPAQPVACRRRGAALCAQRCWRPA